MSTLITTGQLRALEITERVNSSVSVVGILFVISTFLLSSSFNKPINRLIFFASFGNLGSNIASLISEAGPIAGNTSSLCQFQAFLVQMFLGVDCYWAFCMAINVYLVFFRGYTTDQLRGLELRYLLACYGLSFVPALVFVFISTPSGGRIYGDAVIWCWITSDNGWMRIVFLYGIVWVAILFAFVVYGMAGKVIWDKRRDLDGFLNPFNESPFTSAVTATTEIDITYEERPIVTDDASQGKSDTSNGIDPYFVDIRAPPQAHDNHNHSMPAALRIRAISRDAAEAGTNPEAWLYARVAFLFFFALLITWVPSSVNRLYALAKPNTINYPLEYTASFVFPLQGFWNVIVYIITSQTACKKLWGQLFGSCYYRRNGSSVTKLTDGKQQRLPSLSSLN